MKIITIINIIIDDYERQVLYKGKYINLNNVDNTNTSYNNIYKKQNK